MDENTIRPAASHKLPIFLLGLAIIFSLLAYFWLGLGAYHLFRVNQDATQSSADTRRIKSEMVLVDQGLSLSAQLAAATSDQKWKKLYRSYGERITDSLVVDPNKASSKTDKSDDADSLTKLRQMEEKAFQEIESGNAAGALSILSGPEYEQQKIRYSREIERARSKLGKLAQYIASSAKDKTVAQGFLVVGITTLIILVWTYVWKNMRSWQSALKKEADYLYALNAKLDEEVQQYNNLIDGITQGNIEQIIGSDEQSSVFQVVPKELHQENDRMMKKLHISNAELRSYNKNDDIEEPPTRDKNSISSPFFKRLTHELRTPLAVLLAFSEALTEDELSEKDQADASKTILRNAQHLLHVIDNLTEVSKIDTPRAYGQQQKIEKVDAAEEAEKVTIKLEGSEILLADDFIDNQRFLTMWLKKLGLNVTAVENGQEVLNQVAKKQFDLILMDLSMPVMDGFEATKHLRANGFEKPIIAISANIDESSREEARAAGCSDFLGKPLEREVFAAMVKKYLEKSIVGSREKKDSALI